MRRVTPITEQFEHFVRDLKETFWGNLYGKTRLAWKEFLEEQSRKERDRSVGVEDYERAGEKRRGYRNGFYERDFVTRLGTLRLRVALARPKLSAAGPGAISTAGGGRDAADSGGVLARHLDAAGGTGGSDPHRRGGERADGLEAEPASGPFGEGVPAGAFERRMGVPVLGWCELAGAAAGGSKARADAGGLRGAGGWDAPVVGLSAQSGREPSGLGRLFEQSVWARLERQEPAADRH